MADEITINDRLTIPRGELRFRFARSGGPGGQNVNKVESRAELLFDVAGSSSLSDEQRRSIQNHLRSRITGDGVLHIIAGASRSQWQNREDAVERFVELLRKALAPRKRRVKTRASQGSKEKRLQMKRRRSDVKKLRGERSRPMEE